MTVDTSNLIAVPMNKRKDYRTGTRYYDSENILVAKTCANCFEAKLIECFNNDSSAVDGLCTQCRDCRKVIRKKTYKPNPNRKKQPPRSSKKNKTYRSTQTKRLTSRTEYDILSDQQRLRPDGIKKCGSCSTKTPVSNFHRDIYSADGLFRYCKPCHHRKNLERIRKEHIEYWTSQDIPIECYVCGGPYEDSEHIIPLTLGGPDILSNMLPSCAECNRGVGGKHARPLREWLFSKFTEDIAKTILDRVISYGIDPG